MSKLTEEIGDILYQCSIEYQVSIFFVYQSFVDDVFAFPRSWFPGKDLIDGNINISIT
jgi:hypothetical protein